MKAAQKKAANAALEVAAEAQTKFWDALSDLESVLGVDVDGNDDLDNETVESLIAKDTGE